MESPSCQCGNFESAYYFFSPVPDLQQNEDDIFQKHYPITQAESFFLVKITQRNKITKLSSYKCNIILSSRVDLCNVYSSCPNNIKSLAKFLPYHEVWYPANFSPFLLFVFTFFLFSSRQITARVYLECIEVWIRYGLTRACMYRRVAWALVNLSIRTVLPEPWLSAPCFTEYCISERNTHAKGAALINGSYKFRYHS